MTQDVWLSSHAYLQPVAQLHALVDTAVAGIPNENTCAPVWDDYTADFQEGVPLLESSAAALDFTAAASTVVLLIQKLASAPLPSKLAQDARVLDSELHSNPDASHRAVAWLLDRGVYASSCPGLLRYLGWTALALHLHPMVDAFAGWRDEERWLRNYCPACGSRPSMAQLAGTDPGRLRLLTCGCCKTRWRYRRTGCPYCENQNDHRLAVLAVEGEGGLRIDYCESCRGYLKTYDGEGSERVLLADWTSIHLDILAHDRGLIRSAASLYEFS
ncbi:MAG: formate dehydrogenase accessory protein FdhE [Candidatus Sulfotelmatobacter sp.]